MKPRALVLQARGTNRDLDVMEALTLAGAEPTGAPLNDLHAGKVAWDEFQLLVVPGGFSYADALGAGKLLALDLTAYFADEIAAFIASGRPVIGICNGFQALIKLGLVPYGDIVPMTAECPTLTFNTIGRHQSRLVRTRVASNLSPWLAKTEVGDMHTIAISHGEGRFVASDDVLAQLKANGQIATQYVDENGVPGMDLDVNPNGSLLAIEGITSPDGRVFGKMGHSERYSNGTFVNVPGEKDQPLFAAGVEYFAA